MLGQTSDLCDSFVSCQVLVDGRASTFKVLCRQYCMSNLGSHPAARCSSAASPFLLDRRCIRSSSMVRTSESRQVRIVQPTET